MIKESLPAEVTCKGTTVFQAGNWRKDVKGRESPTKAVIIRRPQREKRPELRLGR